MGFWRKPSHPTAKLVSRSPSAVMATMGTPESEGSLRRRSVTSKPSRPGMLRSTRTRSGRCAMARRTPSRPSAASTTSCPSAWRSLRTSRRFRGSSSMCSTRDMGRLALRMQLGYVSHASIEPNPLITPPSPWLSPPFRCPSSPARTSRRRPPRSRQSSPRPRQRPPSPRRRPRARLPQRPPRRRRIILAQCPRRAPSPRRRPGPT